MTVTDALFFLTDSEADYSVRSRLSGSAIGDAKLDSTLIVCLPRIRGSVTDTYDSSQITETSAADVGDGSNAH